MINLAYMAVFQVLYYGPNMDGNVLNHNGFVRFTQGIMQSVNRFCLALLPGESMITPAANTTAVMIIIQFAFKAFAHVEYPGETLF